MIEIKEAQRGLGPTINALQGLRELMKRARTKKTQEALDQEVNYFLSQTLGQDISYSLSLRPNRKKLIQILKEEPNDGI